MLCFTEMYFKTIAIPGMELPVTIVNGFQPLTIVTGISILGFCGSPKYVTVLDNFYVE